MKDVVRKAPTAREINEAHRLARESAETAVEHAIRCGQMLRAVQGSLKHGEFQAWIADHCQFSDRQARRYMEAASKTDTRVRFDSLRQLLGADKPKAKKPEKSETKNESKREAPAPQAQESNQPGVTIESAGESGAASASSGASIVDSNEPEKPSDDEMADIDADIERELNESINRMLSSTADGRALMDEVERQAAEIAVLKSSRDGFMNGKEAAFNIVKQRDKTITKLEKRIKELEAENERLRERISIMEAA